MDRAEELNTIRGYEPGKEKVRIVSEIFTERLILSPISMKHFDDVFEYGSDEETGQYMLHWPKTAEQLKAFIQECIQAMHAEKPCWYEFAIQLKTPSKVIGNVTLQIKGDTAEIGWISNRVFWNKGYMTEAVQAIIRYAFDHLPDVNRIISTCTEKNIASYRVMEKCGLTRIKKEENFKSVKGNTEVTYTKLTYCLDRPGN